MSWSGVFMALALSWEIKCRLMRRQALRKPVCYSAVCLSFILAIIFFTPIVQWAAEELAVDWYEGGGDVLVVLGGAMLVPGTSPRAALAYDSYLRAVYAGWILRRFHFPLVVTSGADGLAEGLATLLQSEGVPRGSIALERRSHSTAENAMYVKELLVQRSIRLSALRVVIITSDFHCLRARATFAKRGLNVRVIPVPDVAKRWGYMPYRLEGFVTVTQELCKDAFYWATGQM